MIEIIKEFCSTYVASYEGIATLVVFLVLLLKLYINRKATSIDFKRMICSIPSEITFLITGFLLSAMLMGIAETNIMSLFASTIISLILLVIQYAVERWLEDKVIGKLNWLIWLIIIIMYLASIILYGVVVFGGVY